MPGEEVWYRLYVGANPTGQVSVIVKPSSKMIASLVNDIHGNNGVALEHCDANQLYVYPPDTDLSNINVVGRGYAGNAHAPNTTYDSPLVVVAPASAPAGETAAASAAASDNILGDGVYEKLTGAVCFFRDEAESNKPIGTGFALSRRDVYSVAHNFDDPSNGKEVVCHFGKPHEQITRRLQISGYNTSLDFCILTAKKGEDDLPAFLEVSLERLLPGKLCILAAFQIGLQEDLETLDPELSVGVFQGAIAKLFPRHFVYQCPSFAGDSGGAIVLKNGKVIGIHQETVNQARERIEHGEDLSSDERLGSVEESISELIGSLASGSIGLQLSAVVPSDRKI